jgi:predicted amidohydrolase
VKISLVQENPVVGDIEGNTSIARDYILKFESSGSDLIVFSELFITGYPPEDLLLREDFMISALKSAENLSSSIKKNKSFNWTTNKERWQKIQFCCFNR